MSLQQIALDFNPWWIRSDEQRQRIEGRSQPNQIATPAFRRSLQPLLLQKLVDISNRRAIVLRGARQVGKTVILRQIAEDLLPKLSSPYQLVYFDFSDDRLGRSAVHPRDVVALAEELAPPDKQIYFLFDEAQYVPGWDRYLKQAVDRWKEPAPHRFIVTGSASLALVRGGAESGLGRWDEFLLEPCPFREFLALRGRSGESPEDVLDREPQAFELYLNIGGFPGYSRHQATQIPFIRSRLRHDIVDKAVMRDLFERGKDLRQIRRLLVYILEASGLQLDPRKCANDLGADKRSVTGWVEQLKNASLLRELPQKTRSPRQTLRSRSKLYAVDHGLVVAFSPEAVPLSDPTTNGAVHETAVYRHLRSLEDATISFIRRDDNHEIDFLVERGRHRIAVEVTTSSVPKARKIERLTAEADRVGATKTVLVHPRLTPHRGGDVTYIPTRQFLMDPDQILEDGDE